MRFHSPHLLPDIFFQVVEGVEMDRRTGWCSHLLGEFFLEFIFAHFQQPTVSVVDDDELLRVEQVVRDDERAKSIVSGNPSGVADHVGIAGMQAQAMLEKNAGIHAGQHGDMAFGADGQVSQGEIAGESFVGL